MQGACRRGRWVMGERKTQLLESVNAVAGKLDAAASELDGIHEMLTNLAPATKPQQVRLASGLTRFAATPIPCVTVGPTNGITTVRTTGNARNEGGTAVGERFESCPAGNTKLPISVVI